MSSGLLWQVWSLFCVRQCSIFFYCSAAHLNLHSFPTRRSSDLNQQPSLIASSSMIASDSSTSQTISHFLAMDVDLDRKSTRLNSSHQIISYAVFCLKKKFIQSKNSIFQ